jgi:hypothetical protein
MGTTSVHTREIKPAMVVMEVRKMGMPTISRVAAVSWRRSEYFAILSRRWLL